MEPTRGLWGGNLLWGGPQQWTTPATPPGPFIAIAEPGNGPPRVALYLTWASHPTAYITRLDTDGRERPVRLGEPATLAGGGWIGYDYEAPFGDVVKFYARDGASVVMSNTVALDVHDVWLRHPGVPDLSVRIDAFTATSFGSRVRSSRKGVFQPMGRETPIVVSDGKRKSPVSSMTVRTKTLEQLDDLIAVLSDDTPLLLSVPAARRWGVTHEYVSIDDVDENRLVDIGDVEDRTVTLPYRVVDRPAGGLQAQWTCADVLTEFATVADVLATFESAGDLLANIRDF